MARFSNRQKPIPLVLQKVRLQKTYPQLIDAVSIERSQLTCYMRLQPSPESIEYKVKITFKTGFWPQVWLIEPKELAEYEGKKPHHKYDYDIEGHARLCVFYPKMREWNDNMYLAEAFVPWIVTWLSAYEYWQITGIWVYPESKDLQKKDK